MPGIPEPLCRKILEELIKFLDVFKELDCIINCQFPVVDQEDWFTYEDLAMSYLVCPGIGHSID